MDRSSFIRKSLLGVSAVAGSNLILAACSSGNSTTESVQTKLLASNLIDDPKAGGLYYTQDAPGRWSEKVGGHLPKIESQKVSDKETRIQVITTHPMNEYDHYIVKHQLLDSNFQFLMEKVFNPAQDKDPISEFILPSYKGPLYALSYCNLHDVWLSAIEV
ncbi:MAG: desulfoferrodoxin family protein [Leptolyngbyaceae cyanobacterium MO_188.B28]|nr:desulfoferrodoxin family protein [Leptolyngbyaceae cyanobacterium MO_188.B28]